MALVASAREACMSEFGDLRSDVRSVGLDFEGQNYLFTEICTRHQHRWDMRPSEDSAWTRLVNEAFDAVTPVIEHVHTALLDAKHEAIVVMALCQAVIARYEMLGQI